MAHKQIQFSDINLQEIGNNIQISGLILSDASTDYFCYLPGNSSLENKVDLCMDVDEWEQFALQSDRVETEIFAKDPTGKLVKMIVRKSNRQIDLAVSWKVYARDNYTCRYCGIKDVPLTVDHLVLWEEGGPSIEANLVTACRKCNKIRGNTPYAQWLESKAYKERSANLSRGIIFKNYELVQKLDSIPRKYHITSR